MILLSKSFIQNDILAWGPPRPLVQRIGVNGTPTSYPTIVRHQQEPLRDQFRDCAGSYTPQVHAQYRRGDRTFYSSHPNVQDVESKSSHPLLASLCIHTLLGNEDFNASSYHEPEPHVYGYLDAHPVLPALESLPHSSRSPPAKPSQPALIARK